MSLKKYKSIFESAARELGLSGAELDERGACTILSKTRGMPPIHVVYDEANDVVDVFAEIGAIPEERADLYREFLAANLFGAESKGATFAFARDTGRVVLQRAIAVDPIDDAAFFAAVLADFAEVAYAARQKIFACESGVTDGAGTRSGISDMAMRV